MKTLFLVLVALISFSLVGCVDGFYLRDQRGGLLYSASTRTTPIGRETNVSTSGYYGGGAYGAMPVGGYGGGAPIYYGTNGWNAAPNAAIPSQQAAAAKVQPGWYEFNGWVFDAQGRPQYSPHARVVSTGFGGTRIVQPDVPTCWEYDAIAGQRYWTGHCGPYRP